MTKNPCVNFDTSEVSIVVQGGLSDITDQCIQSLRTLFPNAEIILSTWADEKVVKIDTDKTILSLDPGAVVCDKVTGTWNNVNRQIVSTQAGLAAATRTYTLKTRTDILIKSADFLSYFGKYDGEPSAYFKKRLLLCNYYTRNPRVFSTCFHPSDWLLFGRTEDLRKYYMKLPLLTDEEGQWFETRRKESTFFTNYICRFTPEQHIFIHFLRTYQPVNCDCYYERTPELIEQTERAFAECFVILDYQKQMEITFTKYDPNRYLEHYSLVSHWQWLALYQHYCVKKPSILWTAHLLRGAGVHILGKLRVGCIRFLNLIGLKEVIKKFLCYIKR